MASQLQIINDIDVFTPDFIFNEIEGPENTL